MCGILGFLGSEDHIIKALNVVEKLEHRGNDGWGCLWSIGGKTDFHKNIGNINDLLYKGLQKQYIYDFNNQYREYYPNTHKDVVQMKISADLLLAMANGNKKPEITFIAHTRWSTHGPVTWEYCHPHQVGDLFIVHNGIFNMAMPYSESDTKNFLFYLEEYLVTLNSLFKKSVTLEEKIVTGIKNILNENANIGDNTALIYHKEVPNTIFAVITGNKELYIAQQDNCTYICSDLNCMAGLAKRCTTLGPGIHTIRNVPLLTDFDIEIPAECKQTTMLEEIGQQATLIKKGIKQEIVFLGDKSKSYGLIGCGSSYNACLFAKNFSKLYHLSVEYASQHQYCSPEQLFDSAIFVSQSGTSHDILKIMEKYSKDGTHGILTNNPHLFKKNEYHISDIGANQEFAVAATKTFSLSCLKLLNIVGYNLTQEDYNLLSCIMDSIWAAKNEIQETANKIIDFKHILLLGSRCNYAIAREGALKLKEVSQVHAEALVSSETKHGSISLIDEKVLTIFIVNSDDDINVINNFEQVKSSAGPTMIISPFKISHSFRGANYYLNYGFLKENENPVVESLSSNMILQLLSYYIAVGKNLNPDRPRRLCKTITV